MYPTGGNKKEPEACQGSRRVRDENKEWSKELGAGDGVREPGIRDGEKGVCGQCEMCGNV